MPAPAQEGSLSPALIDQPNNSSHEATLELSPPLITAEPAEQHSDLGLQIGLSSLAAMDAWTPSVKDDPWGSAHASKISSVSMVAEPDSSTMQLDGDGCCLSLGDALTAVEEETVHGGKQPWLMMHRSTTYILLRFSNTGILPSAMSVSFDKPSPHQAEMFSALQWQIYCNGSLYCNGTCSAASLCDFLTLLEFTVLLCCRLTVFPAAYVLEAVRIWPAQSPLGPDLHDKC